MTELETPMRIKGVLYPSLATEDLHAFSQGYHHVVVTDEPLGQVKTEFNIYDTRINDAEHQQTTHIEQEGDRVESRIYLANNGDVLPLIRRRLTTLSASQSEPPHANNFMSLDTRQTSVRIQPGLQWELSESSLTNGLAPRVSITIFQRG